ncbi:MAG: hypothetical protein ACOYXT_22885 [Bacteroidota bacterium]
MKNASGTFTLIGVAERGFECKGGKILVNGVVGGNTLMAAEVIEIGSDAKFNNHVKYWNRAGVLDFENSLQGGTATYDPGLEIENGKWHYLGFASFVMVLWYLSTALVMIIVIQYLFGLTLKNAANTVKNASLKSLGVGLLFLAGVPIAVVILFVTVIGIPLAVLTLIVYLTTILLATVIVSLMISNWVNNTYYESSWGNGKIIAAAFGIFFFLKLASLTPVIGPLIMLLLACMGFGGILLNVRRKKNKTLALT